ncbi:hypothetical protein C8J56DRAFT_927171 [Mycena floridula]|nr:hypothetical protein C8J56DRAFT_927171 [Mycena floridula]
MPPASNNGGKEKKTRRRLRLSCVECTKRRQKCSRDWPCSLCVSRGVSHLCRWESVPVARPTPQRPPMIPKVEESDLTVAELSARIATLEKTLAEHKACQSSDCDHNGYQPAPQNSLPSAMMDDAVSDRLSAPGSVHSYSSPIALSVPDELPSFAPLSGESYEMVSSLAQLSLAHYGEYLGRGTCLDALFWMTSSTSEVSRHPHVKSPEFGPSPFCSELPYNQDLPQLLHAFPSGPIGASLLNLFLSEVNWRFGIPEFWLQSLFTRISDLLNYDKSTKTTITPGSLALIFSVFAAAHKSHMKDSAFDAGHYLGLSMSALALAEGTLLYRPFLSGHHPVADDALLGCLAAQMVCSILLDRGRVSEAWKLVGSWIRLGQAVGLSRDPASNESIGLSDDQKVLRYRAWWGLVACDQIYSYILGRSHMVPSHSYDGHLPLLCDSRSDQSGFSLYQSTLLRLSNIVAQVTEKTSGTGTPSVKVLHALDQKFADWESQLTEEYRQDSLFGGDHEGLSRQRHFLTTYYLHCRMKLHLAFISQRQFSDTTPEIAICRKKSRTTCMVLAKDLVRFQCGSASQGQAEWSFEASWTLFDATMALLCVSTHEPWDPESGALIERAITILEETQDNGGDIARVSITALNFLMQELGWRTGHLSYVPEAGFDVPLYQWDVNGTYVLYDSPQSCENGNSVLSC